jgi:hypothetical protein
MKIAPWDSYDKTMDSIERKMDREFEALTKEILESGVGVPAMS